MSHRLTRVGRLSAIITTMVAAMTLTACAALPSIPLPGLGGPSMSGDSEPRDNATAYQQLNEIQEGLASTLGVTWEDTIAAGPYICDLDSAALEFQLRREGATTTGVRENVSAARGYLTDLGLSVEPEGYPEFVDGQLVADRVMARDGHLYVELRSSVRGVVTVFSRSQCYSGDPDAEWG